MMQRWYPENVLEKIIIDNYHVAPMPLTKWFLLGTKIKLQELNDCLTFKHILRKFIYTTNTQPNITFGLTLVSQYMSAWRKPYLQLANINI
jgi:hypothetical protein